jgi:hypothetical protein
LRGPYFIHRNLMETVMSAEKPTAEDTSQRLMTRKQALEFLPAQGFPISEAYFSKLCLPSRNSGPPIARWFGGRPLYEAGPTLAWAHSRCGDKRGTLAA